MNQSRSSAAPPDLGAGDGREEPPLGKAYDARLMRRLWAYIRPYRRAFLASLLFLPLVSACSLVQPYLLKLAIDHYIGARDSAGLTLIGCLYALAMVGELSLFYFQYYFTMLVAQKSLADLRRDLFAHLQRQPAAYFDRHPVGRLVTRLTTDVDVINEMFAAGGFTMVMDLVTLAGIVAIMLVIDWRLACVTLSLLPLLLLAINFFRLRARRSYRLIRERIARLGSYLQEALAGMSVVQLFAREQKSWAQFDQLNDGHRRANHAANAYEAALFSLVETVSSISFALIVWYGGGRILEGTLAFGTLVAFIEYVQRFFVPVRDFSTKYAVMQSAMSSAERVFELLDTPPAITAPLRPLRPAAVRGRIELDRVWFAYRGEDYILRDVSFVVEPGEHVALVGATGAGKTTVIKLLNRSYDVQRGRVLIDGIDVRDWDPAVLRRHIGVVLQDVVLFSGTVASNLTLGRPDVSIEAAIAAARTVAADQFVGRLPAGYDERVRERGNNLSTGQRQLLAFARALAYDPAILVLDEATSSVDTETELLIQTALARLMRGRTAVVIAHRLSTIEHADRILVFNAGRIREEGTHAQLLARRGLYYRLYQLQYAGRATVPAVEPPLVAVE
jgi:ATP-binding cassette subfamily B multidrug efflux pump